MAEFIFDQETGVCVARIIEGSVLRDSKTSEKIGTVKGRNVYDIDDNLVGSLQNNKLGGFEVVAPPPSAMPASFRKLLTEG